MNDTYLPFEQAARAYCKSADLDPDALVGHPPDPDPKTGLVAAILVYSPRWIMVAKQLANQHAMNESIRNNPPSV